MQGEPLDPFDAELEEGLDEIEEEQKNRELIWWGHIDLIAWVIRQATQPQDLRSFENWPSFSDVAAEEALTWLATRDPAIWQLARAQIAADLAVGKADAKTLNLASRILSSSEPPRRGAFGDNLARNLLLVSLLEFFKQDAGLNPWNINGKPSTPTLEELREYRETGVRVWAFRDTLPSIEELATALSETLRAHDFLTSLPDAAPTPEAIRAVWRSWTRPKGCSNTGRVFWPVH